MANELVSEKMCAERNGNVLKSLNELHGKIDSMDEHVRNGVNAAIQANEKMIERHDVYIRWMVRVGSVMGSTMIVVMGWALYAIIASG